MTGIWPALKPPVAARWSSIRAIEERAARADVRVFTMALAQLGLGRRTEALDSLERGFAPARGRYAFPRPGTAIRTATR